MKRGQLSLFVIIGLVLLLVLLLFFVLHHTSSASLEKQRVSPVENLVHGCLDASLERLLRTIGANGGYLDTSTLPHSGEPWDSSTVSFPPQDVALWSHVRPCHEDARGCEASEQPPLCKPGVQCPITVAFNNDRPSIQEELEKALPGAVEQCVNNFKSVEFEVKPVGKPRAKVFFTKGVTAKLTYPLIVTTEEGSARLSEFTTTADVDLVKLYRLAYLVAQHERKDSFLEKLTLNLLALYSGVDQPLPPMRTVTLMGAPHYWTRTNVERTLQDEVLPWADLFQLVNAPDSYVPIMPNASKEELPLLVGVYAALNVIAGTELFPGIKAHFFYPGTRPFLSINGGQELLKPRSLDMGGIGKLIGLYLNDYRFKYTLAYPVLLTLEEPDAFDGKGFSWSIGLEANIWRNEPLNRSAATQSFILVNEALDFTNPFQRVKNRLEITAEDKETHAPLPGVRISYQCGQRFYIGETNLEGKLITRFPYCRFGGVLLYSREGYLGSGVEYDNYKEGVTKRFTLELSPLKNITFTVRKRTPEQVQTLSSTTLTADTLVEQSSPLNDTDLVMVMLRRIPSGYDEEVPRVGLFTLSRKEQRFTISISAKRRELERLAAQGVLTEEQVRDWLDALNESLGKTIAKPQESFTTALAPGNYTLSAFLIHNGLIEIPKETREVCAGPKVLGVCTRKKHFTLNATNFTMWMAGGAFLNESHPFRLNENMLRFNYTLYVLEEALPKTWRDLEQYKTPKEYVKGHELLVTPQPR